MNGYGPEYLPEKKERKEQGLVHAGTYSIPERSLPYLVNGDPSGLDDEEIEMVDKFVKEHFPNGFIQNIQWDDPTEFNRSPAFGERDPSALTNKGEPNEQREQSGVHSNSAESRGRKSEAQYPFCAVKTFPVDFYTFDLKQTQSMEAAKEEAVAKDAPAQEEQEEETVSRGWRR